MAIFGLETPHLLVFAGVVLMVLEAAIPGGHFVVLGIALLLAGLVVLLSPLEGLIALAALTLLFGAAALYVYREFDFYGSGSAGQTSDSASLRGETGRVVDRVTGAEGRVKLDDGGFNPYFQARAVDGDIEVGEEVMVTDPGGGNVVTVASLSAIEEDGIDRELRRETQRRAAAARDAGDAGDEPGESDGASGGSDGESGGSDGESGRSDGESGGSDGESGRSDGESSASRGADSGGDASDQDATEREPERET